jgi:hypothetical protein
MCLVALHFGTLKAEDEEIANQTSFFKELVSGVCLPQWLRMYSIQM